MVAVFFVIYKIFYSWFCTSATEHFCLVSEEYFERFFRDRSPYKVPLPRNFRFPNKGTSIRYSGSKFRVFQERAAYKVQCTLERTPTVNTFLDWNWIQKISKQLSFSLNTTIFNRLTIDESELSRVQSRNFSEKFQLAKAESQVKRK